MLPRVLIDRLALLFAAMVLFGALTQAQAQQKPNIILIVGDDVGYGDLGVYGGGEGRGMPTPGIDRLANEGMTLFSFYAQPSRTDVENAGPGGQDRSRTRPFKDSLEGSRTCRWRHA